MSDVTLSEAVIKAAGIPSVTDFPECHFVSYKDRIFLVTPLEVNPEPGLTASTKAYNHAGTGGWQSLGVRSPYTGDPLAMSANVTSRVSERRS